MKPTVAVDWDGTLWDGDWLPGARDALRALTRHATVTVHSCKPELLIRPHLDAAGHRNVAVSERKPNAICYVDDRALLFTDWQHTLGDTLAVIRAHAKGAP